MARRDARWEAGLFVAEGAKLLGEALDAGVVPEAVYVERARASAAERAVAERAAGLSEIVEMEEGTLDRVLATPAPPAVAAVVPFVHVPVRDLAHDGLVVVCAGVSDPGNAGTIIRSAAASGARGVVFPSGAVDIYNPKVVRSTAGALFHVPVVVGPDPLEVLGALGEAGRWRVAADAHGGLDYSEVDLTRPAALVLGSESHGLPEVLGEAVDARVTIPMAGHAESLNVAMAATVVLFEAARQLRAMPVAVAAAVRP